MGPQGEEVCVGGTPCALMLPGASSLPQLRVGTFSVRLPACPHVRESRGEAGDPVGWGHLLPAQLDVPTLPDPIPTHFSHPLPVSGASNGGCTHQGLRGGGF